ncbi:hypothetical protein RUM44_006661 [Polyplax serrata]|uniref:Uncharacterized protein n=1 Tax=Polyplax serrata TaxID=468196 RepID=A0ABR1AJG2_POLSC
MANSFQLSKNFFVLDWGAGEGGGEVLHNQALQKFLHVVASYLVPESSSVVFPIRNQYFTPSPPPSKETKQNELTFAAFTRGRVDVEENSFEDGWIGSKAVVN